jgi:O-methyltransferase
MSTFMVKLSRLKAPDFIGVKWLTFIKALLETGRFVIRNPAPQSLHLARLILQVKPGYTMVSAARLINLYERVQDANQHSLVGDIVECGVWHGGSGAIMGAACLDQGVTRNVWLFDSFQGLPRPGEYDGAKEREFYFEGWCKGDTAKVEEIFHRLRIPQEALKIVPGWFDKTLHTAPVDQIALLHIDADWYNSVKMVLEVFYDRVVPGGFIILDDYWFWQGCKKAVDDFLHERQITDIRLHDVARSAAYFQKPA